MPTKRVPRYREHLGRISPEALRLFARLEATPQRLRKSEQWRKDERALAEMLDLSDAWWSAGASVLDREHRAPGRPVLAYEYWCMCQRVRELLLAACRSEAARAQVN